MRRRVQRKRFNNPKRRARVKTSNKKRVCRDARVISEKLLEQNLLFFGSHGEENMQKCKCAFVGERERRVGVSLSFTCVCVHFPALQRKKGIREGTFSLCVSLFIFFFSVFRRALRFLLFSIYFNISIMCFFFRSLSLSSLSLSSLSLRNCGIIFLLSQPRSRVHERI